MGYLQSVLLAKYPLEKLGARSARELRTIAVALDHIDNGRLPQVADLLMQRFKALEQAAHDGHWGVAQQLELAPELRGTLATEHEQRAAARAEHLRYKLEEARRRAGGFAR